MTIIRRLFIALGLLAYTLCVSDFLKAQTVTIKVKDNYDNHYFPSSLSPADRVHNNFIIDDAKSPDQNGVIKIKAGAMPYYKFSYTTVYVEPGQTLEMDLTNIRYAKDIRFKGPQAAANRWMHQYLLSKYLPLYPDQVTEQLCYCDFRDTVLSNVKKVKEELKAIAASALFKADANKRVEIMAAGSLIRYYHFVSDMQKFRMFDQLSDSSTKEDSLQALQVYKTWEQHYYTSMHDSIMKDVTTIFPEKYLDKYNDFSESIITMYELLQFDSIYFSSVNNKGFLEIKKILDVTDNRTFYHTDFAELSRNINHSGLRSMVNTWEKKFSPLQQGKAGIDWEMEDENGNKVMLSSLKGKTTYIDIWATWCQPCLLLKPQFENLALRYKGDSSIHFIAISVDGNSKPWKSFLEKHNEQRNPYVKQYIISDPKFLQTYQVSGIPRFMLFDKDFHIVDVSAPRPFETDSIKAVLGPFGS